MCAFGFCKSQHARVCMFVCVFDFHVHGLDFLSPHLTCI